MREPSFTARRRRDVARFGSLVASTLIALSACTGATGGGTASPTPVTVPADAVEVASVKRDDVVFRLSSHGSCTYLEAENLVEAVTARREVCGIQNYAFQESCLAYEETRSEADDDGSSESGPPCASEVSWGAAWGAADYDFVGVACVDGEAASVGPGGEYVILVPPGSSPGEPAFLLADGRPVQGPAWGLPFDGPPAESCRRAAGIEASPSDSIQLMVEVAGRDMLSSPTIAVSTDTGFLSLYDSQAFNGDGESVAVFADTSELRIQGLDESQTTVESEVVIPIGEIVGRLLAGEGCASVTVELESDTRGGASQTC